MSGPVRPSPIAGSWYPGEPAILKGDIEAYLGRASIPDIPTKPIAIVSPHAGYVYSGPVAAHAYKALVGYEYSTVVVISPSHRAYFPSIAIWGEGAYETPLGQVPIDEELCEALVGSVASIKEEKKVHLAEHALEIQLPFLQVVLESFRLCPIMMGEQDFRLCNDLARSLDKCIGKRDDVLVVASSDLSHFHAYERAVAMDNIVAKRIDAFDIEGLNLNLEEGACDACGGGPIMAAMLYAKARAKTNTLVLKYANSGDVTGDRSSVVGYLAAVIY